MSPTSDKHQIEVARKTHEGFRIICVECGSGVVMAHSNIGYSPESGLWGGVYLKCLGCNSETAIWRYDLP